MKGKGGSITQARLFVSLMLASFVLVFLAQPANAQESLKRIPGLAEHEFSYRKLQSPLTSNRSVSVAFRVAQHQSLSVGAGYSRFTSFPKDHSTMARPTWKMRAVPLTVAYSYEPLSSSSPISPVLSVGVSYYLSRLKTLERTGSGLPLSESALFTTDRNPDGRSRMGMGYGTHIALGVRADVGHNLFLLAQGRLYHVDGLAFSSNYEGAEFSRADFVVGVGIRF